MIVVNISGKAGSGKDTLARKLRIYLESFGYKVGISKYGDFVKLMEKSFNGYTGSKDKKERRGLQRTGQGIKENVDQLYWVKQVENQIDAYNKLEKIDFVLIPDCRHPEEITYWDKYQVSIRLNNKSHREKDLGMNKDTKKHISETALDNYQFFDYETRIGFGLDFVKQEAEYIGDLLIYPRFEKQFDDIEYKRDFNYIKIRKKVKDYDLSYVFEKGDWKVRDHLSGTYTHFNMNLLTRLLRQLKSLPEDEINYFNKIIKKEVNRINYYKETIKKDQRL